MPKQTFLNLPEEKQQLIREAIYKEFFSHPFQDISLNRIVKDAEISRGSIYQYFDGKEDMLLWIMQETCQHLVNEIIHCLESNRGNLLETSRYILNLIFQKHDSWMKENGYGVLFSDYHAMEALTSMDETGCVTANGESYVVEQVRPYLDLSEYQLKDREEEDLFIDLVVQVMEHSILQYLNDGKNRYESCLKTIQLIHSRFVNKEESVDLLQN